VALPAHTPGCDANRKTITCDYTQYDLDKIARTAWIDDDTPAVDFIKNFNWTNADQSQVAEYIGEKKMTNDAAAKVWIDAHPDKVQAWLKSS
jgi:glycine betaine/proline transport system substrate-binding protein